MATLAKPKHWDNYNRKGTAALRKLAQQPPDPSLRRQRKRLKSKECKHSPDRQHAFAEYLVYWSFLDSQGFHHFHFILSCVYCKKYAWRSDVPYGTLLKHKTVKRANFPSYPQT